MTVLQEILAWSLDRPSWQRDALRRLAVSGELTADDIRELANICKGGHGLAEPSQLTPLDTQHVPDRLVGPPVSLLSIYHHQGVNALAEQQTLRFASGLTVVYGDNGAGKSGYTRIIKNACRARGQEPILGNLVSGVAPLSPVVAIKYAVGDDDQKDWTGAVDDAFLSRLSVFDTRSASVYLTEKTNVRFRPLGLDLFDKLAQACKLVRTQLESDQHSLGKNALTAVQPLLHEATEASRFLASLSSLTKPEAVKALLHLTEEQEARSAFLEKALLDLQTNDPEKLVQQLTLRVSRVKGLLRHLNEIESALSDHAVAAVFDSKTEGKRKSEEAKRLRQATFDADILPGTGTDPWVALWEAARVFSESAAYPGRDFPPVESDARCLLCQQDVSHEAAHRLQKFQAFVVSKTESELRDLRKVFAGRRKSFVDLQVTTDTINDVLRDIAFEHEEAAATIAAALSNNDERRASIVEGIASDTEPQQIQPALASAASTANAVVEQLEARIKTLRGSINKEAQKRMLAEAQELRARKMLGTHERAILDEIERRKKHAAYGQCIEETKTQAITAKSTAVTKTAVSKALKQRFQEELSQLGFRHMEVELKEMGGADGVFYHKLVLARAPTAELPKVVSEGEQRCLSIAAFFAELATADDLSGIVFDDPVSSLDFQWRGNVARRLVEESKKRQVIVFTHDVVFLLALQQYAEELGVDGHDQHVKRLSKGAGVCDAELPWVAMKIKAKVGFLKKAWQDADKLAREGHQDAYEKEAKYLYGLLREGWERALEEVLLGGLVERYRPSIQTQQISQIADITRDDTKAVDVAMTKCSTWLPGHDKAPAARAPVPGPAELKADIDSLESWTNAIRKRRDKPAKAAA